MSVLVIQLCPTLCSPPGSSVHGILQARILEWVAISFSIRNVYIRAESLQPCPTLCEPMDITYQAPLSMGFSRQEYWSGLPCPPRGQLPNPGPEPASLRSSVLAGRFFTASATWEDQYMYIC